MYASLLSQTAVHRFLLPLVFKQENLPALVWWCSYLDTSRCPCSLRVAARHACGHQRVMDLELLLAFLVLAPAIYSCSKLQQSLAIPRTKGFRGFRGPGGSGSSILGNPGKWWWRPSFSPGNRKLADFYPKYSGFLRRQSEKRKVYPHPNGSNGSYGSCIQSCPGQHGYSMCVGNLTSPGLMRLFKHVMYTACKTRTYHYYYYFFTYAYTYIVHIM